MQILLYTKTDWCIAAGVKKLLFVCRFLVEFKQASGEEMNLWFAYREWNLVPISNTGFLSIAEFVEFLLFKTTYLLQTLISGNWEEAILRAYRSHICHWKTDIDSLKYVTILVNGSVIRLLICDVSFLVIIKLKRGHVSYKLGKMCASNLSCFILFWLFNRKKKLILVFNLSIWFIRVIWWFFY